MKKSPNKFVGADKEPIVSEAPKDDEAVIASHQPIKIVHNSHEETKHKARKRDKIKPHEVDMPIFAHMPSRSKMARKQAASDFAAGKVQNPACMLLPDGQVICAGGTVKTVMSDEIKAMARAGKLLIGKALKGAKVRGRA